MFASGQKRTSGLNSMSSALPPESRHPVASRACPLSKILILFFSEHDEKTMADDMK